MSPFKVKILQNKNFFSLGVIFLSCIISFVIMSFISPGIFISQRYSFIRFSDTGLNYEGVFALINNFYHGGIQLWNAYDQMPLTYQHLVAGIYNYTNVMTAAAYVMFHSFYNSPAEAFHSLWTFGWQFSTFLLRAGGSYLLARHFTRNNYIILFSCVLMNTFLVPHIHMGLNTNALFSFFPLMTHFVLRFFEEYRLNDFLSCILTYTLAAATTPLVSVSYFYLGTHFVLVSIMVWALVRNFQRVKAFFQNAFAKKRIPNPYLNQTQIIKIVLVLTLCLIVILPSVYMLKANYRDYEFDHEHSRFTNMMGLKAYFERSLYFAPKEEFLWRLVDYTQSNWTFSWVFAGYLIVFLIFCGLVLSRDNRKYIFLGSVFLFWIINSPRMSHSWTDIGHWINALTNPFKFAANTFHMGGALQMCFVFFPLVVMGLQAIFAIPKDFSISHFVRLLIIWALTIAFTVAVYPHVNDEIHKYVLKGVILSSIILILLGIPALLPQWRSGLTASLISFIFLIDCGGTARYIKETFDQVVMISHKIKGIDYAGWVDLDYRNPEIFPRRLFYFNIPLGQVSYFLNADAIGQQGLYYQFTDLNKYFMPVNNYKPRHKAYAFWPGTSKPNVYYPFEQWPGDKVMLDYIRRDTRLIFEAPLAVPAGTETFSQIVSKNWDRSAVMVEEPPKDETVLKTLPDKVPAPLRENLQWMNKQISLNAADHVEEHYTFMEYRFNLPPDFPSFLSSTIFTNDRVLTRVIIVQQGQTIELTPAQGRLIRPMTFDVRNMYTNALSVMLPKDFAIDDNSIHFLYWQPGPTGMTSIWKNEPDNFGFNYTAAQNGWLVLHYPYDKRWKISVDDREVPFYKANQSFIGVPIKEGAHRILVQYWPGSPLRGLIFFSMIFYMLAIPSVIWFGIKEANRSSSKKENVSENSAEQLEYAQAL